MKAHLMMSKQQKHYFTLKTNYIKQQDQSEVRTVNLGFILPFGHKLQLGWYFSILGAEFGQLLLELVILLHQCFITFHTLLLVGGEHFLELQNTTARHICSLKALTDISKGSCHHLVADEGSKYTLFCSFKFDNKAIHILTIYFTCMGLDSRHSPVSELL